MKTKMKALIAALTLAVMLPFMMVPASANSRSPYWYGTNSSGAVSGTKDIPIEVVSEKLTFDIPTLPYTKYRSADSFLAYDSKVTAEYTFHNPTDMTVTAKMLFPYGRLPEYSRLTNGDGESLAERELEKYQITVNGLPVEKTVRHSAINSYRGEFDTDAEIQKISDEMMTIGDFGPETMVTKYTVKVSGIDESYIEQSEFDKYPQKYPSLTVKTDYHYNTEANMAATKRFTSEGHEISGDFKSWIKSSEQTFSFFVIGESDPNLTSYSVVFFEASHSGNVTTPIDCDCEISYESTTLEAFANSIYKEDSGISTVDWFNSIVVRLGSYDNSDLRYWVQGNGILLRWYEYEITLEPGETITNSVTAPLYPAIDTSSGKFFYNYLLSPASDFASFGNLEVIINTEYEMVESNLEGFEKTDDGYRLVREGLPKEGEDFLDLNFTLKGNVPSTEPHPNIIIRGLNFILNALGTLLLMIFVLISDALTWIADLFR